LTVWDASSGAQISTVSIADNYVLLGVDATGRKAVLVGGMLGMDPQGSYRKAISVNIKTGEITAAVPLDRILDLVYLSPAGDRILVCGGRGVPRVYSVETGQLVFELKAPDRIPYGNGLWSSSGKWIMTPDRDGSETIWDSASGKPARTWPNIGSTAAAMDPQDSVLATANDLGRVEIRDVHTCELLRVIEDRIGWVETKPLPAAAQR
jgi:WD40 repeat protein